MVGAANAAPTVKASALFFIPPLLPCFAVSLCGTNSFNTLDSGARYKCVLLAVNNERRDCLARATWVRRVKHAAQPRCQLPYSSSLERFGLRVRQSSRVR